VKVFAIDPGSEESGVLIWDGREILLHAVLKNAEVLSALNDPEIAPDCVACEMIQAYGMAVGAEVFETCYVIGGIMRECHHLSLHFHRVKRMEVKMHLCNDPKAKDPNIRQALIDRLGPIGNKKDPGPLYGVVSHAWSALAIAVTAFDRSEQIVSEIKAARQRIADAANIQVP
jgi:hypothetical protein